MLKQYRLRDYKFRLVLWVAALSSIGVLVVGSANEAYRYRQLMGVIIGLVCMVIVSLIDYVWLLNFYWLEYLFGILLLALVPLFGYTANGAKRWIRIGSFQFQPSDVVKIIMILFLAKLYSKYEDKINHPKIIFGSLIAMAVPVAFIYKQPNLSTSILMVLLFCAMIFLAGLSYKIIGGIILVTIPVAVILLTIILQPNQTLIDEYQQSRILAWLQPEAYSQLSSQQTNSIIAIGSGQLYGKGLNNDDVSSVKNGNFIPEPQTDFIFTVVGEELGFLGCCIIIILELLIALECVNIGRRAREKCGTLIGCGMGVLIFLQCFINICVATGLMPNTGIALPFVSYGLTSLVSFWIGIGIVLNVGLQVRKY